jgi:ABC-type branched-subunit amino acid transport system substrate-binding protein
MKKDFAMRAPRWIVCALAGALAAGTAGCGDDLVAKLSGRDGTRVGAILTVGETVSSIPSIERLGIELAVEEINAAGGVLDKPLRVEFLDDGGDAAKSLELARSLYDQGIEVIIGPGYSGATMTVASELALSAGMAVVSYSATSPAITTLADGGLVSRTVPSDVFQGAIAARSARRDFGREKASIVYIDNAYGQGLAAAFAAEFAALGGAVLQQTTYPDLAEEDAARYDFASLVDRIFAGDPDLLLLVTYDADGVYLTNAMRARFLEQSERPLVMGVDGNATEGFLANADQEVVRDMVGTQPASDDSLPDYAAFLERFQRRFGVAGSLYASTAYDATYMVALAVQAAGGVEGRSVAAWIRPTSVGGESVGPLDYAAARDKVEAGIDVDYKGVSGDVDLDENGDPESGHYELWKNAGGKVEQRKIIPFP